MAATTAAPATAIATEKRRSDSSAQPHTRGKHNNNNYNNNNNNFNNYNNYST
jgi:hypothetical protein